MPKSPSGSGPPRRSKARAGEPGKNAPRPEAQILSPDARGDTSTEVPPAGVVIELPARPRKAVRQREYKPPSAPRFRIFIIDSGWNSMARRVLRHNFALIRRLYKEDLLYLLSQKKIGRVDPPSPLVNRPGSDYRSARPESGRATRDHAFSRVPPASRDPAYSEAGVVGAPNIRSVYRYTPPLWKSRGRDPQRPSPRGYAGGGRDPST